MKALKYTTFILITILFASLITVFYSPIVYADEVDYRYVIYKAAVYEAYDADAAILDNLTRNNEVILIDSLTIDGVSWCKIKYFSDKEGYVLNDMLYQKPQPSAVKITKGYLTVVNKNQRIQLYLDQNGTKTDFTLRDGTAVEIIERTQSFAKISYNGEIYYIDSKNVTTGITYYQSIALIIGLISLSSIIIIFMLAYANNNVKYKRVRTPNIK